MRFLILCCCIASTALANDWQKLSNCELIESRSNDGDSFHVRHEGREYIFRLCYVDTPEPRELRKFTKRTTEQAKYFAITKTQLFRFAEDASSFTKNLLSQPFTVWTDGTDAQGNSQLPRQFGILQTAAGDDLGERLVQQGLARVYGYSPNRPDGTASTAYRKVLKAMEKNAFNQGSGAWTETLRKSPPLYGTQIPAPSSTQPTPTQPYAQSL